MSTVKNWYSQTPKDFVFAVKMPRQFTHGAALINCSKDISNFFRVIDQLKEKLGPIFFKFSLRDIGLFGSQDTFLNRLLLRLKDLLRFYRFAVSVPERWITRQFVDALRTHRISLAFGDDSCFEKGALRERPAELLTSDFVYIRWVGEGRSTEQRAKVWDRIAVSRHETILRWVEFISKELLAYGKVFAYATNQYEGHAPSTAESFRRLLDKGVRENIKNGKSQGTLFGNAFSSD
jgi:uncharacterized protein YecE (DUF72 family)